MAKDTKARIITSALALFNEQGDRDVTTNHIAKSLGISTGVLYYHFRNKEEIIRAIFQRYIDHIESTIRQPDSEQSNSDFLAQYCEEIFDSIWRYRFLHANMPALLARDSELQAQYLAAHQFLQARAEAAVRWLSDHNIICIQAQQIPILVDLMRLVTGFWVGFSQINSQQALNKQQVCAGIVHLIALLQPYCTASGQPIFDQLIEHYQQ
ncbi:TetR/AcrR family transcriptional regulator [Salinibius halmophilus]|uniref:TetR/AcrR family transcriptional regulator n=1 Tax=Salinibius halmophilus TaxID=1853216 RepID=UPI000E66A8E1|nr:TetR/AcrR family transcriptional regulator [Salinibius halmophilus]